MRKIESSGNTDRAMRLRLRAESQVTAERLLDDDAPVVGQTGGTEPGDDGREQRGRNGQIVCRMSGIAQGQLERLEGIRVVVVALDVAKLREETVQRGAVTDSAAGSDAVRCPASKLRQTPLGGSHADHWNRSAGLSGQCIERRKDHFMRKIAGHTEQNQSRRTSGHSSRQRCARTQASRYRAACCAIECPCDAFGFGSGSIGSLPSMCPPKPKRMAESIFSPKVCSCRERNRA